jgi:hypothetical protein
MTYLNLGELLIELSDHIYIKSAPGISSHSRFPRVLCLLRVAAKGVFVKDKALLTVEMLENYGLWQSRL